MKEKMKIHHSNFNKDNECNRYDGNWSFNDDDDDVKYVEKGRI